MSFITAQKMLDAATQEERWAVMNDHFEDFFHSDEFESIEVWNELAARRGIEAAWLAESADGATFICFQDRRIPLALRYERGDNELTLHTLNKIAKHVLETRYCHDTTGNSDIGFLPLTPSEWSALEAQYGIDAVDALFLRMHDDFDEFMLEAEEDYAYLGDDEFDDDTLADD